MNKSKLKFLLSLLFVVTVIIGSIFVYNTRPIEVIAIPRGTIAFIRGLGRQITSVENEDSELKVGDIIYSVNGKTLYCYDDVVEIVDGYQENEFIDISYVRDSILYDSVVNKKTLTKAKFYNYRNAEYGAVSMIEPKTMRYAFNARKENGVQIKNFFSGIVVEALYSLTYSGDDGHIYSNGNVIGSITDFGEKSLYGYIEPTNYNEEYLVEIAHKHQVKNGKAVIEVCDFENNNFLVEVVLKCEDDKINVTIEGNSNLETFANIGIRGLAIFQDGKMVGVFAGGVDEKHAYAWYAIDVYNEMMSTANWKNILTIKNCPKLRLKILF